MKNTLSNTSGRHASGRILARVILCLVLTFALIAPMAMPTEVSAASKSKTSSSSTIKSSKKQTISGCKLVFKNKVQTKKRLAAAPTGLTATGKRNGIKIKWTKVSIKVSGYYIMRYDPATKTWKQIDAVKPTTHAYTDKKATAKDTQYIYTVVAYKKYKKSSKKPIIVSKAPAWAGAVTTASSKNNVTSLKITNLANAVIVMKGSYAQAAIQFPENPYTTALRWSSSQPSVAAVDSKTGRVTGVNPGKAVITARMHTGNTMSYTITVSKPGTAQAMIDTFYAWNGFSELNGKHKGIIDIYNSILPWPAGYKMRYSDAWCDATVTAAAIKTGNVERIGRECGVPRHITIFKQLGIWEEDGTIKPRPGDIIVYSWKKGRQPNNSSASHIGIVVKVDGNKITCLEGNRGIGVLDKREIPVGWGFIRGYARPHYVN